MTEAADVRLAEIYLTEIPGMCVLEERVDWSFDTDASRALATPKGRTFAFG